MVINMRQKRVGGDLSEPPDCSSLPENILSFHKSCAACDAQCKHTNPIRKWKSPVHFLTYVITEPLHKSIERCNSKYLLILHVLASLCHITSSGRLPREVINDETQLYLMNFGYLPQSDIETGNLRSEVQLREAIRTLQKFGNVPVTGHVDSATKALMARPRCGVPDYGTNESPLSRRKKRYNIQGQKWEHTNLTWSVRKFSGKIPSGAVRNDLRQALDVWAVNSKLEFTELNSDEADILIYFYRGYHNDGYPFDGEGTVLAHAFFPGDGRGGDTHFDEDENWILTSDHRREDGVHLFSVAAHEFGHALGLSHSSVEGALMYPWYQGNDDKNFRLPDDDRIGIQMLYGASDKSTQPFYPSPYDPRPPEPPTRPPLPPPLPTRPPYRPPTTTRRRVVPTTRRPPYTPPTRDPHPTDRPHYPPPPPGDAKPDTCDTSYDAISVIRGQIFIFKGEYFWRLGENGLEKGYPVKITRFWYGLPQNLTHIDAVYERTTDLRIVFFIGNQYWVFKDNRQELYYPRPVTDLGLPKELEKIDGAMVWGHNGRTYFFSGTMYWRFDESVGKIELDYPRDMSMWQRIPYHIDAVFQYKNGKTYFFKEKVFWEFDDQHMRAKTVAPMLSAPYWMGCPVTPSTDSDERKFSSDSDMFESDHSEEESQANGSQQCSGLQITTLFLAIPVLSTRLLL